MLVLCICVCVCVFVSNSSTYFLALKLHYYRDLETLRRWRGLSAKSKQESGERIPTNCLANLQFCSNFQKSTREAQGYFFFFFMFPIHPQNVQPSTTSPATHILKYACLTACTASGQFTFEGLLRLCHIKCFCGVLANMNSCRVWAFFPCNPPRIANSKSVPEGRRCTGRVRE